MKQSMTFLGVILTLAVLVGCCPPGPNPVTNPVTKVPIVWQQSVPSKSIAVTVTPGDTAAMTEFNCNTLAPVVTGWQTNTQYAIGDSYTSTVFGQSVVTTISAGTGTDVVFTGSFSDGEGYYKVTYHADDTFDFEQAVIYDFTSGTVHEIVLMYSSMANVSITNTSYSGTGRSIFYDYNVVTPASSRVSALSFTAHAMTNYFGALGSIVMSTDFSSMPFNGRAPVYADVSSLSGMTVDFSSAPQFLVAYDASGWGTYLSPDAATLAAHWQ